MRRPAGRPGRSAGPGFPTCSTGSIERTGSADIGRRRSCRSAIRLRSAPTWISRRPPMRLVRRARRPSAGEHVRSVGRAMRAAANPAVRIVTSWRSGTEHRFNHPAKETTMSNSQTPTAFTPSDFSAVQMRETAKSSDRAPPTHFDAVIIGAGFAGMYMLHSLRDKLGMSARVLEAGNGVGGTWYWNRYPGARCDTPSFIYCYTFDRNLLQEWEWSERYPEQDEILRYLEHCADRFDLKPDIDFGKRVNSTVFDETTNRWTVRTERGDAYTARYVIAATDCLTAGNMAKINGIDTFKGRSYQTSRWPHSGVDFTAKRVAVIGTGATGVQAVPIIAPQAQQLTVFQRTPSHFVPARNGQGDPQGAKAR